jgi:hypothetical protein
LQTKEAKSSILLLTKDGWRASGNEEQDMSKTAEVPSELLIRRDPVKHASLAFMAVCLLVAAILAVTSPLPYAQDELWMRASLGILGIPAALALLYINVRKLTSKKYAVRIDESGILDESSAMSPGFVPWGDIADVYLLRLKSGDFLCIQPKDVEAWVAGLPKSSQRLANANTDMGYAPMRVQIEELSKAHTCEEAVSVIKGLHPELVRKMKKPKY